MKKRFSFAKFVIAIVGVCALTMGIFAFGAIGAGADDPAPEVWDGTTVDTSWYNDRDTSFKIGTPAELAGLAAITNGTVEGWAQDDFNGKTVTLTADIDLGGEEWTPIGTNIVGAASFSGTFFGNGKSIINLYIDMSGSENVGLFGCVNENGTVQNLKVAGQVTGGNTVGGIVGDNIGTVQNCIADITVKGNKNVGGIVGENDRYIDDCTNFGSVEGKTNIGGIAGHGVRSLESDPYIKNSSNHGSITSTSICIGGIVGNIEGASFTVENCFNFGDISNYQYVGGIVGYNDAVASHINNCYNGGSVVGSATVGGIAGVNKGNIYNCYWDINMSSDLAGSNSGTVTDCADTKTMALGAILSSLNAYVNDQIPESGLKWGSENDIPKFMHKHISPSEWSFDDSNHWRNCVSVTNTDNCGEPIDFGEHIVSALDPISCEVCGAALFVGTGTEEDPYIASDEAQLQYFIDLTDNSVNYIKLANDIHIKNGIKQSQYSNSFVLDLNGNTINAYSEYACFGLCKDASFKNGNISAQSETLFTCGGFDYNYRANLNLENLTIEGCLSSSAINLSYASAYVYRCTITNSAENGYMAVLSDYTMLDLNYVEFSADQAVYVPDSAYDFKVIIDGTAYFTREDINNLNADYHTHGDNDYDCVCDFGGEEMHEFTSDCDTVCNKNSEHTRMANVEHTPEADDWDCVTPILCSECGEEVVAAYENHYFEGEYYIDEHYGHYQLCMTCYEMSETVPHEYEKDNVCRICGYVYERPYIPDEETGDKWTPDDFVEINPDWSDSEADSSFSFASVLEFLAGAALVIAAAVAAVAGVIAVAVAAILLLGALALIAIAPVAVVVGVIILIVCIAKKKKKKKMNKVFKE